MGKWFDLAFFWPIRASLERSALFEKVSNNAKSNGENGIKRIAKLAIQRDLPENFQIAFQNVFSNKQLSPVTEEDVRQGLETLLERMELTNNCIGQNKYVLACIPK